jgi:Ca2+-binding RTX toxin-like protein
MHSDFIQPLESRRMFAATAQMVGSVLTITGTGEKDTIVVKNHAPIDAKIDVVLNGVTQSFFRELIKSISVTALAGNDAIDLRSIAIPAKIAGNAGNDQIYGSQAADRISGGSGKDWISGQAGNDIIYGEAANDRLFGDSGKDKIYAGAGTDTVRGGKGIDRITATIGVDDLKNNKEDTITNIVQ